MDWIKIKINIFAIKRSKGLVKHLLMAFFYFALNEWKSHFYSCSLQRSDCEQIALDFYKKEQCQRFTCDLSELLSKKSYLLEKKVFCVCFWQFSPFSCQKSKSLLTLFAQSLFLKDRQDQFTLITLYKRATVRNRSHWSLQKSDREQIDCVNLQKRATGAIHSYSRANLSFAILITKN